MNVQFSRRPEEVTRVPEIGVTNSSEGSRVLGVESRSYAGVASALNGWPISLAPR